MICQFCHLFGSGLDHVVEAVAAGLGSFPVEVDPLFVELLLGQAHDYQSIIGIGIMNNLINQISDHKIGLLKWFSP